MTHSTPPYLDLDVFKAHRKVFVGDSDTTVTHLAMFRAGIVSFYGPAIMAGLAENCGSIGIWQIRFAERFFHQQSQFR